MGIRSCIMVFSLVSVGTILLIGVGSHEIPQRSSIHLIAASYCGTEGPDDLADVAFSEDGTIYLVGNASERIDEKLPKDATTIFGQPLSELKQGQGFVLHLDRSGSRILNAAVFAKGLIQLTSVAVAPNCVYIGGYGTEGLNQLIEGLDGVMPSGKALRLAYEWPLANYNPTPGQPCVLRLSRDLRHIEAGTFLEGWMSLWIVPDDGREWAEPNWQPVEVEILSDGRVVVAHDGGYYVVPPKGGAKLEPEDFYLMPDYLSCLSPDLKHRFWRAEILTPEVDPLVISISRFNDPKRWTWEIYGNPRTLRARVDGEDKIHVCGWTATRTAKEPWWCPFLRQYSPDGKLIRKLWEPKPTAGDGRMYGLVSDAAVRSIAFQKEALIVSVIGDGGNTIMGRDPRDFTKPIPFSPGGGFKGRICFWGGIVKLTKDGDFLAGYVFQAAGKWYEHKRWKAEVSGKRPVWAQDVAVLRNGHVVAVGRNTEHFQVSPGAWYQGPGGFIAVFDEGLVPTFITSLPDIDLQTVATDGYRCAAVGVAWSDRAPVRVPFGAYVGGAPVPDLRYYGERDGYFILFEEVREP